MSELWQLLDLLAAADHKWGAGKVHIIRGGVTLCGQTEQRCVGEKLTGYLDAVTCLSCTRNLEAEQARKEREAQWKAEWEDRQRERREESRRWWAWYDQYLGSPEWRARRSLVLDRCQDVCEGCRSRPATEVHHLTYERVGNEMLFDLVGLCSECHSTITAASREKAA